MTALKYLLILVVASVLIAILLPYMAIIGAVFLACCLLWGLIWLIVNLIKFMRG